MIKNMKLSIVLIVAAVAVLLGIVFFDNEKDAKPVDHSAGFTRTL